MRFRFPRVLPRSVTFAGLLAALVGIFIDPTTAPALTTILGDDAGAKVSAAGAIIAALGRGVLSEKPKP